MNNRTKANNQDPEVAMLMEMGFDVNQAKLALEANNGDVDLALDDLCSGIRFSTDDTATGDSPPPAADGGRCSRRKPKEVSWQTHQEQEDVARRKANREASSTGNTDIRKHPVRATSSGDSDIAPLTPPNRQPSGEKAAMMASETGVNQSIGAIAVSGPRDRYVSDLETGNNIPAYVCDDSELVVARAVHPAPAALRQHSDDDEVYTAELMPPPESSATPLQSKQEPPRPFWTKKLVLIAVLIVLLVAGAVTGTLLALSSASTKEEQAPDTTQEPGLITIDEPGPITTKEPTPTTTEGPFVTTTTEDVALYTEIVRPAGRNVGDRFADFVVVSRDGTTIAAGAEVGNYVQVYRDAGTQGWKKIGQTIHGSGGSDQFGKGLGLNNDGSMLVVGAWNNDDEAEDAGHVKVFRLEGDEWKQVGQTLVGRAEKDHFGWYVSMSDDGNTIAASAHSGNAGGKDEAGYVRVFTLENNDSWIQLGNDLVGEKDFEQFGRAMAITGDGRRLAVGTTRYNQESGIVRVFDFSASGWSQVGQDLTGSHGGSWFGSGIALNLKGDVVAIGADGVSVGGNNKAGMVRVFHLEGCCIWKQCGQDILGEENQGRLGMHQVGLSNDGCCLVAGASKVNDYTGKGYMYTFVDDEWKKIVEISGDARSDELGESVSLSGDGSVAVFGARENDTSRPGYFKVYDSKHERPC